MKNTTEKESVTNRRIRSFGYAWRGMLDAYRKEVNIRIQTIIGLLVIVAGIWLDISLAEWLFIALAIGLVISAEIFNTAIELLVDFVSPDYNKSAGRIKDLAAGAVLVAAITSAIIGLLIFVPRLIKIL